ncbi:MAG TPA: hydroxyacid dehydrogenase [Anaerolineales bacterium]|nr:hydroxyacid dehydrogenase [Anaerolineales bacterium]|tara:strand:- start:393 stop:1343 length:951 start_codon:yes stop_codon:yes gene_type:complete
MNVSVRGRVLVADTIAAAGVEKLRQAVGVDVRTNIDARELLKVIGDYRGLVVRSRTKVMAEVVAAATKLDVVGRAGVGVDNIDLEACKRHGITVVNSPMAASVAVAELTLAFMLCLARRVPFADTRMKQGEWPKKQLKGVELDGKTLGLIAVGRIGSEVARRAIAFGMRVIAYDPYLSADEMRVRNVEPATLETVLSAVDYISVHTPLTDETHHMINAAAIDAMRDGVRILCAARGGVIDEAALLAGLESGKVAGAALDVFESEPPGASALVKHPHVITTAHIGAQTREAQDRAGVDVAAEVISALSGAELRWKVV